MALTKESEESVQQLQLIEQNLQNLVQQRQQFQSQLIEIESALKELKGTKNAYKIIGNIMVATEPDALNKDLDKKKETINLRISTIEKREKGLKDKAKDLQEKVLKDLERK